MRPTVSVILIREQAQQLTGSGCCGKLDEDDFSVRGRDLFHEAREHQRQLGVLHLVPVFPYAVVNTLPAACGVRLRTFVLCAFLGVLPSTLLLAQFGSGLGDALAQGSTIELGHLLTPQILSALAGLGLLALLPVLYRAFRARRP